MEEESIRFSLFRGRNNSVLTKQYRLNDSGDICKDSAPYFSSGTAETVCIERLSDIESIIGNLKSNECISTGIVDSPSCEIVTSNVLDDERLAAGVRSRTKKHMAQPSNGIVLLDHDIGPDIPDRLRCDSPEELISKLKAAIPRFASIAYSGAGSCSQGITVTASNKLYKGGGLHVYISAEDVDLLGLQRYLVVHLWMAGLGYIALARNGAMLERCIVDLSVLSPERLIYEAEPVLGDGLSRRPREWQHRDGTAFSSDLSLTDDEIAKYEQLVASAKSNPDNKAKAERIAAIYHDGKIDALAEHKSISQEAAKKLISKQTAVERDSKECLLHPNDIIEISGNKILVSELLEHGGEFDNSAMPDPIEGSSYGMTTAKFYNNDGNNPCIVSLAHGVMKIYRLEHPSGFTPCEDQVIAPDKQLAATPTGPRNPLVKCSLRGMGEQLAKEFSDQVLILGRIILMYQSSVIYAAPNTGKTLIILKLLINAIKQGLIDPSKLFYINVDDTPNGLIEKLKFADKYKFHMLAGGYNGFKADDLLGILTDLVNNDLCKGVIIILDTVKKFTDLMDKRISSRFGKVIRSFVLKGGTCISLAHTNKHRTGDGKPVYAGTTDIIDDADCAYLLYEISSDDKSQTKVIQFENVKSRGNVARKACYRYGIADGLSYSKLFDSVEPVDDTELVAVKQAAELKSDSGVINAITQCIREGINTKMKLATAAAERSGISKRAVLRLIEKYAGTDPALHKWTYTVQGRGAKVFSLLAPDTAVSDHVGKP